MKLSKETFTALFSGRFKRNVFLIYWSMLVILVILEIFVIKNSVSIILSSQAPAENVVTPKGVRVNFANYKTVIDRFESANSFQPSLVPIDSPFKSK